MLQNKIYRNFIKEILKTFLVILFGLSVIAWTVRAVNFLDLISEDEDNEDIAIKIAKAKHSSLTFPNITEDDDDDENFDPKAVAYTPFSRDGDEFTFIKE